MRKPKSPGVKGPAVARPPAGGRALERLKQFARARGLPVEIKVTGEADRKTTPASAKRKKTSK